MRWGQFKSALADAVVAHLQPIQERYHAVIQDTTYLDQVRPASSGLHPAFRSLRPSRPDGLFGCYCSWQHILCPVQVLAKGAAEAEKSANWTLNNCRQAMGFVPRQPLQ